METNENFQAIVKTVDEGFKKGLFSVNDAELITGSLKVIAQTLQIIVKSNQELVFDNESVIGSDTDVDKQ